MNTESILTKIRQAKSKMDEANAANEEAILTIREAMIEARTDLDLSAERFAKLCDITPQYVFRIEAGKAHWSEDCLNTFMHNLEVASTQNQA